MNRPEVVSLFSQGSVLVRAKQRVREKVISRARDVSGHVFIISAKFLIGIMAEKGEERRSENIIEPDFTDFKSLAGTR